MTHRVQVYSRDGCHLCDTAIALVDAVCAESGQAYRVIDIDGQPELRSQFSDQVPVVLVDGEVIAFWRIDPQALRNALARK